MAPDSPDTSRLAVISDIHGNKHALEAALAAIEAGGVGRVYCCGDVVGYGAFPNECCQILRDRNIPTIAGNHDHAALRKTDTSYFNDVARVAILWTADELTETNRNWLAELPMTLTDDDCFFVHASPQSPEDWNYILNMNDARTNFEHFSQAVCFIGHSHQPFIVENDEGTLSCPTALRVRVGAKRRYLVNVGSVGQPRDRNHQASYAVYDRNERILEVLRVNYDVESAQKAIRDRGLPVELGERLAHGW